MTVIAVACCPHPPALVPALASGAAPELELIRAASRAAVAALLAAGPDEVFVLGSGPRTQEHAGSAQGSFARYGLSLVIGANDHAAGPQAASAAAVLPLAVLPLALTLGAWLLADAGYDGPVTFQEVADGVGADSPDVDADVDANNDAHADAVADAIAQRLVSRPGRLALLVMGDGSACRSAAAPGGFDARAEPFDHTIAAALETADSATLAGVDRTLAAQLLVAGAVPWKVLGRVAAQGAWSARLLAHEAPWGVAYFAAAWTRTGAS